MKNKWIWIGLVLLLIAAGVSAYLYFYSPKLTIRGVVDYTGKKAVVTSPLGMVDIDFNQYGDGAMIRSNRNFALSVIALPGGETELVLNHLRPTSKILFQKILFRWDANLNVYGKSTNWKKVK